MEKSNIKISNMSNQDILDLRDTLISDFDNFWTFNILKQEFSNKNTTYVVAKEQNKIVGFAGFLTIIDEANIMNIVTKKDKRKLGIGTLLLENLIKQAKEKNLTSITLEVNEKNIPAINLYKKFQFKQVGIRKKYYSGNDSAILMTLYL
ncbi:MAG: ribosomal protein S18-alanine N-acetyltransferase [Clostridia bacterium]|nr:ribosomal protein S18-alanine N-acetyltransferase [Clostridia bacterium]